MQKPDMPAATHTRRFRFKLTPTTDLDVSDRHSLHSSYRAMEALLGGIRASPWLASSYSELPDLCIGAIRRSGSQPWSLSYVRVSP